MSLLGGFRKKKNGKKQAKAGTLKKNAIPTLTINIKKIFFLVFKANTVNIARHKNYTGVGGSFKIFPTTQQCKS